MRQLNGVGNRSPSVTSLRGACDCRTYSDTHTIRPGATPGASVMEIIRNDYYKKIATRLIKTEPCLEYIKNSSVRIAYLESDQEKKKADKIIQGECHKVAPMYQWAVRYDFMIIIYKNNILDFTPEQEEILLLHELLHVGINNDGNEPSYYVVPHDVEEFNRVSSEWGYEWAAPMKENGGDKYGKSKRKPSKPSTE